MDNLAFARQGSGQWLMGELERWVWVGEWWGPQSRRPSLEGRALPEVALITAECAAGRER